MIRSLKRLVAEENGATLVEYALLVVLIGMAVVTVVSDLATSMGNNFTNVGNAISGS